MTRFVGICGSLRANSSHQMILQTIAAELLPANVGMDLLALHDIPSYNEDLEGEGGCPEAVRSLRQAILEADALVIGAPEYNHGISGVLKNALDWLSRPHGRSVLKGKPVLAFTASPAFTGGVRAHQQLNETLWAIPAEMVRYPQIVIGGIGVKIEGGRLIDEPARQFLSEGLIKLWQMTSG